MTLEEVYNALGADRPFSKSGEITDSGYDAHRKLAEILKVMVDFGVVHGLNEDILDTLDDSM